MSTTTRRRFLELCTMASAAGFIPASVRADTTSPSSVAILRLETDPVRALIPFLSWDTEGGDRSKTNLLRSSGVRLRMQSGPEWVEVNEFPTTVQVLPHGVRYVLSVHDQSTLQWEIAKSSDRFSLSLWSEGPRTSLGPLQLVIPLNPSVTPTTVIPSLWRDDGKFDTPLLINAPDFGQMLLEVSPGTVSGMLEGSRLPHTVDLILDLPEILPGTKQIFSFTPVTLPAPAGLQDKSLWKLARRGWFGAIQPSASWGDCSRGYICGSAGILANNVISDPASVSSMFYVDLIFFTPEIAKGIPAAQLTRRTVEFWVKKRALHSHEIPGYVDYVDFLDGNPQQLICAWDYVESTSDLPWLEGMIGSLEGVAEFTARRDQDLDGLVEAAQSGNAGTLWINNRSSNWFDAVNYGHKDAYSNALIYRGWRCLADLEAKLNRTKQQQRYTELADRLKAAYTQQLFNPKTGWITCWKSEDGGFHDYCSPIINSMAISYGLVEPEQGRQILDRLWDRLQKVKFDRFDLGIPTTLDPVHRSDYLQPQSNGVPLREDGTDTFQHYQNAGIAAGHTLHFLVANYTVGYNEKADGVLRAMLGRQQKGLFQNGIQGSYPNGGEWTTWEGQPCGYEGYLGDTYYFLLAVLMREADLRKRIYRPLS
jgi:hypothetical protein